MVKTILLLLVSGTMSLTLTGQDLQYDVPRESQPNQHYEGQFLTFHGQVSKQSAAIVNGEPIPLSEVEHLAGAIIKNKFALVPATAAQKQQVRHDILNMLIEDRLMRQFLDANAPKVVPADVDKELAKFAEEYAAKNPGKKIDDFYRESKQTEQDFRRDLQSMLQWGGYIGQKVTEAELKRYYDANKDFFDQVTVRASHILKQVAENASEADRKAVREQLSRLRAEIVAGTLDFAEAAKKESQCQVSAESGGDIGYFPRKFMWDESFAKLAFELKVGDVSELIETPFGYHILKVTDRKVGRPSEFDQVKDEVHQFYVEELRQELISKQREKAKIEINLK